MRSWIRFNVVAGILFPLAILTVFAALVSVEAEPEGWEEVFLSEYEGRPTARGEAVEKFTYFLQREPRKVSVYLVRRLAGSAQGRTFLKTMSDKMDDFCIQRLGSGWGDLDPAWAADPIFSATEEQMAGTITGATDPIE